MVFPWFLPWFPQKTSVFLGFITLNHLQERAEKLMQELEQRSEPWTPLWNDGDFNGDFTEFYGKMGHGID